MGERRREPLTKFPGGGGAERAGGGAGERASGRAGAGNAQRRLRAAPVRIAPPPPPPGPSVRPALGPTAGPGDSPSCCRQSAAAISPSQRHAAARPPGYSRPAWHPRRMAATRVAGSWGCIPETQEPGFKAVPPQQRTPAFSRVHR